MDQPNHEAPVTTHPQQGLQQLGPMEPLQLSLREIDASVSRLADEVMGHQGAQLGKREWQLDQVLHESHCQRWLRAGGENHAFSDRHRRTSRGRALERPWSDILAARGRAAIFGTFSGPYPSGRPASFRYSAL